MNCLRIDEVAPGACGLLIDENPPLTAAHIKPYIVAILLHRGAVKESEIAACLVSHCCQDDLKVGAWDSFDEEYCDCTRLEKLIDDVLGEYVSEGILRYNEEREMWVLTGGQIPTVISWAAALGSKIPQHLSLELSRQQLNRIPDYIEFDHATD
jgi:hypothetical protein